MTGLKRWLAGLLAWTFLLSGAALADGSGRTTVEIQESMVSREGESTGSVEEGLLLLAELLQQEEVLNMLKFEDVSLIARDIVWEVLCWMAENRPVTIKILREFGIGETDLRCIEKIWDSADRVSAASRAFRESEEGKRLGADFDALWNDPDFRESMDQFMILLSSDALGKLMDEFSTVLAQDAESAAEEGPLAQAALERNLNRSSWTGALLLSLLDILDRSEWARESLPKLLENEKLWTLLVHLAETDSDTADVLRAEFSALTADPEVTAFLQRTGAALSSVAEKIREKGIFDRKSGTEPRDETEEAAP